MCSFMWRDTNHSHVPMELLEECLKGLYEEGETIFIATRKGSLKWVVLYVISFTGQVFSKSIEITPQIHIKKFEEQKTLGQMPG